MHRSRMNTIEHFIGGEREGRCADGDEATGLDLRAIRHGVIKLSARSRVGALTRLLKLRASVTWLRWRLRAWGATEIRAFAFFPTLDSPTIVYELAGRARRYVETHVLPTDAGLSGPARRFLATVAGCDPGVGGVVVVGRRR